MNYLDNAATTLVKPRAVGEAVHRALTGAAGYARGGYAAAQRAGDLVYDCREQAAALFGLYDPSRVVFTQNATHALNIAIHALARPGMKTAVSGAPPAAPRRFRSPPLGRGAPAPPGGGPPALPPSCAGCCPGRHRR